MGKEKVSDRQPVLQLCTITDQQEKKTRGKSKTHLKDSLLVSNSVSRLMREKQCFLFILTAGFSLRNSWNFKSVQILFIATVYSACSSSMLSCGMMEIVVFWHRLFEGRWRKSFSWGIVFEMAVLAYIYISSMLLMSWQINYSLRVLIRSISIYSESRR